MSQDKQILIEKSFNDLLDNIKTNNSSITRLSVIDYNGAPILHKALENLNFIVDQKATDDRYEPMKNEKGVVKHPTYEIDIK